MVGSEDVWAEEVTLKISPDVPQGRDGRRDEYRTRGVPGPKTSPVRDHTSSVGTSKVRDDPKCKREDSW